jgi:hypothetical protein
MKNRLIARHIEHTRYFMTYLSLKGAEICLEHCHKHVTLGLWWVASGRSITLRHHFVDSGEKSVDEKLTSKAFWKSISVSNFARLVNSPITRKHRRLSCICCNAAKVRLGQSLEGPITLNLPLSSNKTPSPNFYSFLKFLRPKGCFYSQEILNSFRAMQSKLHACAFSKRDHHER